MTSAVLDSWAILHLLEDGPQAGVVPEAVDSGDAVMSWINLGEVSYIVQRRSGTDEARAVVEDVRLSLDVRLPDPDLVLAAPGIKAVVPMSYADAVAAATARAVGAPLLTGDPELLTSRRTWEVVDLRG